MIVKLSAVTLSGEEFITELSWISDPDALGSIGDHYFVHHPGVEDTHDLMRSIDKGFIPPISFPLIVLFDSLMLDCTWESEMMDSTANIEVLDDKQRAILLRHLGSHLERTGISKVPPRGFQISKLREVDVESTKNIFKEIRSQNLK